MKGENSSKCRHIHNIVVIPINWEDRRNADITLNWRYMRSIAEIPKLSEVFEGTLKMKTILYSIVENVTLIYQKCTKIFKN
jgi:hypothetical protein